MLAATLAAALLAIAPVGPPTLCHPFEIGDAKSLPWGEGAFERHAGYDLEQLPHDTYDVLLRSDDPLVHAETLRRAVLYLTGSFDVQAAPPAALRDRLATALLSELQFDVDAHAADAAGRATRRRPRPRRVRATDRRRSIPRRAAASARRSRATPRCAASISATCARRCARPARRRATTGWPRCGRLCACGRPIPALELVAALGLVDHSDAAQARAEGWRHLDSVARRIEAGPADDRWPPACSPPSARC